MKAVILSHEDGGTYVLDKTGSFKFVKGYEAHDIGEEIDLKPEFSAAIKTKRRAKINYFKPLALAACLIMVFVLGGVTWMWNSQSHSIYVDINPSVELTFNRFNRLMSIRPLNDDGEEFLQDLNLRGAPEDVVVSLINEAKQNGYTEHSPAVIITFTTNGPYEVHGPAIAQALERDGLQGLSVAKVYSGYYRYMAREFGVSPGRLRLAKQLYSNSCTQSLEDFLNKTVRDLIYADPQAPNICEREYCPLED